jgi:DNA processing protein
VDAPNDTLSVESRALLALWAVPGLGPKALQALSRFCAGPLATLLDVPVGDWVEEAPLPEPVRASLRPVRTLERVATRVLERCAQSSIRIAFQGERAFPELLCGVPDAPPLLFYRGEPLAPRRRIAMVGSRHPEQGFLTFARTFARQVAEKGAGIVSGAALGVDRACHLGALDARAETWAFLGSALDEVDPAQVDLVARLLDGGGMCFSELPPRVRASKTSFPRRNRLISGASDAVLLLRAGKKSGSLYTAEAAQAQGRPVLALPGDVQNPAAEGCNEWIFEGHARLCRGVADVCAAIGLRTGIAAPPGDGAVLDGISAEAKTAYRMLERVPRGFDEVLLRSRLSPAALTSALGELELSGLAVQLPGKLYERV